jgi:hypothetical protein
MHRVTDSDLLRKLQWLLGNSTTRVDLRVDSDGVAPSPAGATRQELASAIFEWIEAWGNPGRRHSAPGYHSRASLGFSAHD